MLAVSDLHVAFERNREVVATLRPEHPDDWLLVAGDVGERLADVVETLARLRERFATVVWAPGNHELWTHPTDTVTARGVERYQMLVEGCRRAGVLTPEDRFASFAGRDGPVRIAPVFALYDYSWLAPGASSVEESIALARSRGVYAQDQFVLHPDPYPSRPAWCRARVELTEQRLRSCDDGTPLVLVSHWPLVREPTRVLRHPEFAQWCGTEATSRWHVEHHVVAVVYGHLHIPRVTTHDGVPFHEVSLGYPREWQNRLRAPYRPRVVTQ